MYLDVHGTEQGDPPTIEVIAPDVCNVMFVDSNGDLFPPNPCIKYWHTYHLERLNAALTDDRNNYRFRDEIDGAMYLVGDLDVTVYSPFGLDLRGNSLYYGGELLQEDPQITDSVTGNPRYIELLKTTFGDFNVDCKVTYADRAVLVDSWTGQGGVTTYPLADSDGDCDVDVNDMARLSANLGNNKCWCEDIPGYCTVEVTVDCPAGGDSLSSPSGNPIGTATLELRDPKTGDAVAELVAGMSYEVHYVDAVNRADGYALSIGSADSGVGAATVDCADVGEWQSTGNLHFMDLEAEADALMPIEGFDDHVLVRQLVVDQTYVDGMDDFKGQGLLCLLTPKGEGEIVLELLLEATSAESPVLSRATSVFTVVPVAP